MTWFGSALVTSIDLSTILSYAFLYRYLTIMLCVHLYVVNNTDFTLAVLYPVSASISS